MRTVVRRDRLVAALAARHELTLCSLVAPAGFGRTVLLDQAAESIGPDARDIRYDCSNDDADTGTFGSHLTMLLTDVLGTGGSGEREPVGGPGTIGHLLSLLARCDREQPTALCLDRFERSGAAGTDLLRQLVADAPPGVHIVVSARHLGHIGLGRLVVAGRGRSFGWRELAYDPSELSVLGIPTGSMTSPDDEPLVWPALAGLLLEGAPELITDYLVDEVLAAEPAAVVKSLAALAAIEGCTTDDLPDVTGPVLEALTAPQRDDVIDRMAELPLVGRGSAGCWPNPIWIVATRSVLEEEERRAVVDRRITALLERGAVSEAGRMAVRVAGAEALRAVVRSALTPIPVGASVTDLRAWQRADLLGADVPERLWLDAVIRSREDDESTQFLRLEDVRRAFEELGDLDGEAAALLHLGNLARARGDTAALLALLARAQVLAARGDERAVSLVALGEAISAQLSGRPADAVRTLDAVAIGSLPADWAAQARMIRGTNLLLSGRIEAAVTCLEAATGEGSEGTLSTAHDLLSTARWQAGDPHGAMDDAALSVSLAAPVGPPSRLQLSQSWLACLLAATGQDAETTALLEQIHAGGPVLSSEGAALAAVAEALLHIDDPEEARSLLEGTDVLDRPVRSSLWRKALLGALSPAPAPDGVEGVEGVDGGMPGFDRAVAAGAAGRRVLAGGPAAEARHRPFLPARWCEPTPASTAVALFGIGTVHRDHRLVEHPAWQRGRVRELCLHLALVDPTPRGKVAATLWPDRDERSAGQNLRVTLSHLLDVLDPGRERSRGSRLLREVNGAISLDPTSGLRVDVWEIRRHAEFVLTTPDDQRASVLARARRLLAARNGPLLRATPVGEWCAPYRRRLDDLVLSAAGRAGALALHSTDLGLAVDLGRLMLDIDPWTEEGHRLVVEGQLSRGDRDGARRALGEAVSRLDELGVAPGQPLVHLGYRLGLTHRRTNGSEEPIGVTTALEVSAGVRGPVSS